MNCPSCGHVVYGKAMFIMIILSYAFGFSAFCRVASAALPERTKPPAAAAPAR